MTPQIQEIINLVISDDIKVVSFDVFDTLLMRPCISPTDIFKLAGKKINYSGDIGEMRRLAEIEARRNRSYGVEDVTLDEIYFSFSSIFDINPEVLKKYKQAELDTEYRLLYPRKSVKFIFESALKAGKEVILTSDMYLSKQFLQKVLEKNGYKGYSKIYVSSEEKVSKGSGNLFKKIINDYIQQGISPTNIVHIGDNYKADIVAAENNGLNAGYIPKAYNEFLRRDYLKKLNDCVHKASDNSFLIGYIANTVFDDPFVRFDLKSYAGGNITHFSYIIMMPFLFSFSKWLVEESIKDGIEELIMVYRDGFLPEQIVKIISKYYPDVPQIKKIYLSRAIRYNYFSLQDNGLFNSISDMPVHPDMTIEDFIKNRLLVTDPEETKQALNFFLSIGYCSSKDKIGSYSNILCIFPDLEKIYHKNADLRKQTIDRYCTSIINKNRKTGVFDVGYRGSVSRFLANNFYMGNTCYHLLSNPLINFDIPSNAALKSYVQYGTDTSRKCMILHPLIEDIISKQEGSALNVIENGGQFQIVMDDCESNDIIDRIQREIVEFSESFTELMGDFIPLLQFDHYLHFDFLVKFFVRPNKFDAANINRLNFTDSKFISTSSDYYERWYNKYFSHIESIGSKEKEQVKNVSSGVPVSNTEDKSKFYQMKFAAYKVCELIHILPFIQIIYRNCFKNLLEKNTGVSTDANPNVYTETFLEDIVTQKDHRASMDMQIECALEQIKKYDLLTSRENTVIMGDMVSYDKGICNYLNHLSKMYTDKKFVLLSEATWVSEQNTKTKISFPCVIVPEMFGKNRYPANARVTITPENEGLMKTKPYLQWAVDNWCGRHEDMSLEYAQYLSICAYKYYSQVLDILNVQTIILWNQFHGLHHIIEHLAKEKGISVKFIEFGSLPGTIAIEDMGQMGESYPAVRYDDFKKIAISDKEFKHAKEILSYLKDSKMNRNIQAETQDEKLKAIKKDKPIILYAGQNDYESGIIPYNEHSKKYHSPVFASTNAALYYLANLCKKNDWTLLYKPHPIMKMFSQHAISIPDNVIYLDDIDINEVIDFADVTVTILSQVAYVSLIREKATLMLGYNQLRGKDCAYEAYDIDSIEKKLKKAIDDGYTRSQKRAFIKHTAQLIKCYLYDDLVQKEMSFGQGIGKFFG